MSSSITLLGAEPPLGGKGTGRRGLRHTTGGAVAQRLLEIGDRADDLVECAALPAWVGEPLAREEPPRLVLVAPARLPALEQAIVDRGAHAAHIGKRGGRLKLITTVFVGS